MSSLYFTVLLLTGKGFGLFRNFIFIIYRGLLLWNINVQSKDGFSSKRVLFYFVIYSHYIYCILWFDKINGRGSLYKKIGLFTGLGMYDFFVCKVFKK
ncbi:hypothetical protein V1523DRAFT_4418 [Lipomyces doorenjongii]